MRGLATKEFVTQGSGLRMGKADSNGLDTIVSCNSGQRICLVHGLEPALKSICSVSIGEHACTVVPKRGNCLGGRTENTVVVCKRRVLSRAFLLGVQYERG